MVKKFGVGWDGGGGITSHVPTPHTVLQVPKGNKLLAKRGECPLPHPTTK